MNREERVYRNQDLVADDRVPAGTAEVLNHIMESVYSLARQPPELSQVTSTVEPSDAGLTIAQLVHGLHENNTVQWNWEDEVRRRDVSAAHTTHCKRTIDALNLRRHAFIEAIDDALTSRVDQDLEAEPHTETVGMIVDRLSVLELRRHQLSSES